MNLRADLEENGSISKPNYDTVQMISLFSLFTASFLSKVSEKSKLVEILISTYRTVAEYVSFLIGQIRFDFKPDWFFHRSLLKLKGEAGCKSSTSTLVSGMTTIPSDTSLLDIVLVSLLLLVPEPFIAFEIQNTRTEELGTTVAMPNLLHTHQSHFVFLLHPPISTVRSMTQAFHFPQSMAPTNLRTKPSLRRSVRCMANPRRVKMVAKQIMRELSDMLLTDTVLQHAVLPEAALGADRYLSSLTTISDVEVSNDLQVVKVYVSVFGDDRGKDVAIAGLKAKAKYVRSELGKRMKLRMTPEVRFIEDESMERGSRVIAILDKLKAEKGSGDGDEGQTEPSDLPEDGEDWEVDDPDEDIIYVK